MALFSNGARCKALLILTVATTWNCSESLLYIEAHSNIFISIQEAISPYFSSIMFNLNVQPHQIGPTAGNNEHSNQSDWQFSIAKLILIFPFFIEFLTQSHWPPAPQWQNPMIWTFYVAQILHIICCHLDKRFTMPNIFLSPWQVIRFRPQR